MSAVNPYMPPRADVADIVDENAEFQEPNILSWRGRIGRLRYMAYVSGAYLLFAVFMGIVAAATGVSFGRNGGSAVLWSGILVFVAFTFMAAIQRAHDLDWSGWSVLLMFVPFVGAIMALIWLFKSGTDGANRFGPPPTPNTWGVRILGCLMPALFVIGILAAIALPAYQQYTKRAHAAEQVR